MSVIVYSYDPQTGAYIGETVADVDQLDPDNVLYPAFTTNKRPHKPASGHQQFFVNGAWEMRRITVPAPVIEQVTDVTRERRLKVLTQDYLDRIAASMGHRTIDLAVTYADEPAVPKYQLEGQRLRRLRSLVWMAHEEIVKSGQWPEENAYLARLPTYDEVVQLEDQTGAS